MPFHFQFNPKEQLDKSFDSERLKLTSQDLDSLTLPELEKLTFDQIRILRNSVYNPEKFDFFLKILLNPGGYPDFPQTKSLLGDYDTWRNTNNNVDFSKDPAYFVIDRVLLTNFIKDKLIRKELIVKFGCNGGSSNGQTGIGSNNFSNLSIFIAGMTINDYTYHSLTDYIECTSMTTSPTHSNTIDSNFRAKTSNFSGRAMGRDITKIGVSHNLDRRSSATGAIEYGFLEDFLSVNPLADKIYIYPAYDQDHQGNFTVIFSTEVGIDNIPEGAWPMNKVYNFGSGCCPPA